MTSVVNVNFFVLRLLSLPGAPFPSLWFRVSADRCRCSGVRLIGFDRGLAVYVRDAFRRIDSVVMIVDVVKS